MRVYNKTVIRVVQIILGIALLFFGLNGFLMFMTPPQMGDAAMAVFNALGSAVYFFPLMNLIFLVAGVMFILNRFSALATIMIFPIFVNVVLFHLFLDIGTILFGLIMFVLNVYMIGAHVEQYRELFKSR